MKKVIVAAVSINNVIGKNGKIPWHSQEELSHFKNTTSDFPVLMGRRTWQSLIKPLENRLNIILSRDKALKPGHENVHVFNSFNNVLQYCEKEKFGKIFIIGGGEIYKEAINFCDEIILSKMNFETDGDVFFPEIKSETWKEISKKVFTDFTVHYYIRK